MPDWLRDAVTTDPEMLVTTLVTRLGLALALGCVVGGVYRLTRRPVAGGTPSLTPTLVLLTVLIALVTLAIGNSVARAFSLVGALAIVRFRTVVEDTRDTAFVIFAVAIGMAVGAGLLKVALVGLPFAAVAAFLFASRTAVADDPRAFLLTVRVGTGHDPSTLLSKPLARHLERWVLTAAATTRQGAAFDLTYRVRLRSEDGVVPFIADLNGLEGVQNVEMRQG